MSLPSDLLAQAKFLVTKDKGKPKQANLRRAVSTAYYALFHFLGEQAVAQVVGVAPAKQVLAQLARRALIHGKMYSLCKEFTKPTPSSELLKPLWRSHGIPNAHGVLSVAQIFCEMQQERHDADYNLAESFTKAEASWACDLVEQAFRDWNAAKKSHPEVCLLFALALLLWPSLSAR